MTQLINTRKFVTAFSTRNVVFESFCSYDKAGSLVLRTCMEFANNGRIKRSKVINVEGMSVHNIHTAIGVYQADVLDLIDTLESYCSWVRSNKEEVFSEFIGNDDTPLYFHGHRAKGFPSLSIFGQDLLNLELVGRGTPSAQGEHLHYLERIEALAECYRDHLKELDKLPASSFEGSFVNRVKATPISIEPFSAA